MKTYIFLIIIFFSLKSFTQQTEITELENQKKEILNQIKNLTDSIKNIELKINKIKSKEIQKMVTDSTLKATVTSGAKLRNSAGPYGKLITTLIEDKEVVILDYKDDYFGVCTDSICGYMSDLWIKKNDRIKEFIKAKETEEDELKRLEKEQKLKNQRAEYAKLEKKYIKKYGQKVYNELKQGYYWIGMNREMATISLGSPNDINRTVGSWGVHEQWVYDNLFLYFENGKLKSYQN
ncbi:hypothetical protein ADIWIN_1227 [Winogradskyella psychrotolerans RS-3]|uniref:SH3b domain-containing protein n=1 Tax=Winogradskyella psychrotolerans RS-3 TaxID=641526 RepID=S7VU36_9FLAO|nr:hypothetical protein [Winogradskyella psychrotolerans]EPR73765.1 hypothetical protein ADIWIN_1227 [Winogradskyella psychrotolerans RS-3]